MITCADVVVRRDLSPDIPIGSDRTDGISKLVTFYWYAGKHTRLSDATKKHVLLEVAIGVVKR
jgi:hypothetical protein